MSGRPFEWTWPVLVGVAAMAVAGVLLVSAVMHPARRAAGSEPSPA